MFSFWGLGGNDGEQKQEVVAAHDAANDMSPPLTAVEEASMTAEAGSEGPSLPLKSSSESTVLVQMDDALPCSLEEEGVIVKAPATPPEEAETTVRTDMISPTEASQLSPSLRSDGEEGEEVDDELDLRLVEAFDKTFNEFCAEHSKFLLMNPDLVHSMRVAKLQKILSDAAHMENELFQQLETLEQEKRGKEADIHRRLMNASRKKAAREIHLQSMLAELQVSSKETQENLKWKTLLKSEARAKKQYKQRKNLQREVVGGDRIDLLAELPDNAEFEDLRYAILDSGTSSQDRYLREHGDTLTPEQEQELRQLQVDNAILNSEVNVLKKRTDYQKQAAKKNAWVESVLVRMDPKTLKRLKSKHEMKAGTAL